MDLEELRAAVGALDRLLSDRVEVWRTVVDAEGRVISRIYRGSFAGPLGPRTDASDTHHKEKRP